MIQRGSRQSVGVKQPHPAKRSKQAGLTASVHHSGQPPKQTQSQSAQPQFSGIQTRIANASKDKLISVFGAISEVFLVAFLAQDVVGMWLPRVGVSLKRGRIAYDPESDPNAKSLPMGDKVKLWLKKNIQGLNWVNFTEEAGREFATGPGVLMIPTAMYAFARRAYGKSAIELGHKPLKELSQGFINHLDKVNNPILNQAVTKENVGLFKEAFEKELKNYLVDTVGDESFKKWNLTRQSSEAIVSGKHFEEVTQSFDNGKQWLDNWVDRYTKLITQSAETTKGNNKAVSEAVNKQFHKLEEELKTVVVDVYNKDIKLGQELEKMRAGVKQSATAFERSSLMRADHVLTNTGINPNSKPVAQFLEELHRGKDYFGQIFKEKVAGEASHAKLSDVAKGVFDKIVARKGLFAGTITLLAGAYLIELAKFVQSHDAYPGERNVSGHGNATTPAHTQPNTMPQQAANQTPLQQFAAGGGH